MPDYAVARLTRLCWLSKERRRGGARGGRRNVSIPSEHRRCKTSYFCLKSDTDHRPGWPCPCISQNKQQQPKMSVLLIVCSLLPCVLPFPRLPPWWGFCGRMCRCCQRSWWIGRLCGYGHEWGGYGHEWGGWGWRRNHCPLALSLENLQQPGK